jgi:hypothetical protein
LEHPLDQDRIDKLIQFALLVAGRNDEPFERELGPIHLIKYVYLADLAYAERRSGETFTGVQWRFHHYGPWSAEVHDRIVPALTAIDAEAKQVPSNYDDDFIRWVKVDDELFEAIDRSLPTPIALAVKRLVRRFGKDTSELLHHVYTTRPMLRAAPGSYLSFADLRQESFTISEPVADRREMTAKEKKRYEERAREAKKRIAASLAAKRAVRAGRQLALAPRYDEVFARGVQWLDSLAGEQSGELEGEASFTDDVWTSDARGERRDG